MRVVVLPDIHGRFEALAAMLRHCGAADASLNWAGADLTLVQLGDVVDRGPRPRACVDLLTRLHAAARGRLVALKGNHEDLLLRSGESPLAWTRWMLNDGRATVESYGEDFERLCRPGGAHFDWFSALPLSWEQGGVFFVHGGLSRGNLEKRDPQRLMWDRPPLTRGPYQALVCGHTPTPSGRVEVKDHVFFCDIGLGWGREAGLEYLEMDLDEGGLRGWKVRRAD